MNCDTLIYFALDSSTWTTVIVRHDSPQTVGKLFDIYYGTSREVREGPYSPASPLNTEQDEERDEPLTVLETPTTPNASTAPPKETKKKKKHLPSNSPQEAQRNITHQSPRENHHLSSTWGISTKGLVRGIPWMQGYAPKETNQRFLNGQTPFGTNSNIRPGTNMKMKSAPLVNVNLKKTTNKKIYYVSTQGMKSTPLHTKNKFRKMQITSPPRTDEKMSPRVNHISRLSYIRAKQQWNRFPRPKLHSSSSSHLLAIKPQT